MRKSTFSEAQIVAPLREGEVLVPAAVLQREYRIFRSTFDLWKSKYRSALSIARICGATIVHSRCGDADAQAHGLCHSAREGQ
jgi:hypothetical protein